MRAAKLHSLKLIYSDGAIREETIWRVPTPVLGSSHDYKYSLVYIVAGDRVIGYDNERGKGDHRHFHGVEGTYQFRGLIELLADFRGDVERERS